MSKNSIAVHGTSSLPAHLVTDTAKGNENITAGDLAVPYLSLLQSLSKPCTKGAPEYVKGAEPGHFFNTVTKEFKEEIICANMFVDTVYAINKKRGMGDDYQGEHISNEAALSHLEQEGLNPSDYDITETHKHMLALFNEETGAIESAAIYSLRSTALKASRLWNTQILTAYPNADRFAGIWKLTAQLQTNKFGSWHTPVVELQGYPSEEVYAELQANYKKWRG